MIVCPVLVDESHGRKHGHVMLPFYCNRRFDNGYERWAAYEFPSRDEIDIACENGTPILVDRHPDGQWYREWGSS